MTIDTVWQALLFLAAGITALVGAGSAVFKLFNPYKQILARLAALEGRVTAHDDKLAKDLGRFEVNDARDCMMMDALFALLEHARTNNSTGLMEETSKKMQAYLIHRK